MSVLCLMLVSMAPKAEKQKRQLMLVKIDLKTVLCRPVSVSSVGSF